MGYVHFSFETAAFKDSPEIKAQNINELAGHALAQWLSAELKSRGFTVSQVWADDHGWDFGVSAGGSKFQCACSINDDEEPLGDAHVVLGPKAKPDNEIVAAVAAVLRGCNDVQNLEMDQ